MPAQGQQAAPLPLLKIRPAARIVAAGLTPLHRRRQPQTVLPAMAQLQLLPACRQRCPLLTLALTQKRGQQQLRRTSLPAQLDQQEVAWVPRSRSAQQGQPLMTSSF